MKIKKLINGSILFVGLGLAAYSWLSGYRIRLGVEDVAVDSPAQGTGAVTKKGLLPKNGKLSQEVSMMAIL